MALAVPREDDGLAARKRANLCCLNWRSHLYLGMRNGSLMIACLMAHR